MSLKQKPHQLSTTPTTHSNLKIAINHLLQTKRKETPNNLTLTDTTDTSTHTDKHTTVSVGYIVILTTSTSAYTCMMHGTPIGTSDHLCHMYTDTNHQSSQQDATRQQNWQHHPVWSHQQRHNHSKVLESNNTWSLPQQQQ